MPSENGWFEYKQLVLSKFADIKEDFNTIDKKVSDIQDRLGKIEGKVSNIYAIAIFCSTVAGLVVGVANLVISNFLS